MPLRIVITAYVRFANALAWHALESARGLHAAGHEVLLFCQRESPLAAWAKDAPFAVNADFNLNRLGPVESVRALSTLRKILRTFRPDILNPHCPPGHSFLALVAAMEHWKAPLIRTIADPRSSNRNFINRQLHLQRTHGLIFSSREMQRRYLQIFPSTSLPAKVISPGFRADDFARDAKPGGFRQRFGLTEQHVLAGIVARMSPEKGQEVFLQALALLPSEIRARLFCIMAGEDSRERGAEDLLALAKELGVDQQIAFCGKLDRVQPLMAELDVGLVTSVRSEAICRVALEYMSFGLPVIASDINILPDIICNEHNGWLYHFSDARQLAQCLTECINTPTLRQTLGINGAQMVRDELSLASEIAQVVPFYETAILNNGNCR